MNDLNFIKSQKKNVYDFLHHNKYPSNYKAPSFDQNYFHDHEAKPKEPQNHQKNDSKCLVHCESSCYLKSLMKYSQNLKPEDSEDHLNLNKLKEQRKNTANEYKRSKPSAAQYFKAKRNEWFEK